MINRISRLCSIMSMMLLPAMEARAQALEAVPNTVEVVFSWINGDQPFDTVSLVNKTGSDLRVDSITIRFLDGGATPKAADFTACKTCPPDSIRAYLYGGWLYGSSLSQSMRYLRDSLFLIQDKNGNPVTVGLPAGTSVPFVLNYPVNCPACGRMPSYPGASRYAFTFIASEGSRAVLNVEVTHASGLNQGWSRPKKVASGSEHDAAGRSNSRDRRTFWFRKPSL